MSPAPTRTGSPSADGGPDAGGEVGGAVGPSPVDDGVAVGADSVPDALATIDADVSPEGPGFVLPTPSARPASRISVATKATAPRPAARANERRSSMGQAYRTADFQAEIGAGVEIATARGASPGPENLVGIGGPGRVGT